MVISFVTAPDFAQAQNWEIEPIVKIGVEYDDNATLSIRTDEELEVSGYLLELLADIKYSSETTSFSVQPSAFLRSYPNDSVFDSEDFYLESRFRHEGQSSTFGFRADADEQSVRTAERAVSDLDIDDPDDITDDDTGRIVLFGTRSKFRLSPYWDYRVSNTSLIGASIDYYNVQYEDVLAGFLTDYSDARLNLNYRRTLSNVNTALFTATARRYDSAGTVGNVSGYGIMAGLEHALSETTRLTAMIGLEESDLPGISSDPEVTGRIRLTRNLETIRMFAQYRRTVGASGASNLTVRDSLNLNFERRLSEKVSAGLGVRAYQTRGVGGLATVDERNYVQLQSSFTWYLTRAFVIEANYRYTVNDRSATFGERSNANQVNLWFVYQPKTIPRI